MESILGYIQSKPLFYLLIIIVLSINFLLLILLGLTVYYFINIANQHVDQVKRIKLEKKHLLYVLISILFVLLLSMIYNFRTLLKLLINPLLWALIFSYLLNPIVHLLDKRGISRLWSVVILYSFITAFIAIVSITVTPKIIKEVKNLVELLPRYTTEVSDYINSLYKKIEQLGNFSPQMAVIGGTLEEHLVAVQNKIIQSINGFTKGIFNTFSNFISLVLVPIYSFYFLKDTDSLRRKLSLLIPKDIRPECIQIFRDINKILSKFIRGQLLVAVCVGILSTVALLILRVNFAFLIGMIAGISNIIPYIGPIIGAIPGVAVALLDQPMKAIWVIVAFTIIQQIESAILSPKIVGESVGLHPIIIILTLIIGNEAFGVVGMLFGVPVVASLKIVFWHMANYIIKAD